MSFDIDRYMSSVGVDPVALNKQLIAEVTDDLSIMTTGGSATHKQPRAESQRLEAKFVYPAIAPIARGEAEPAKTEQLQRRERELDERERKLKEAEEKAKRDELDKLRLLEDEVEKLRVREVAASELTMVSKPEEPLGQGSFKRALLCEWRGLAVVKLEFVAPANADTLKAFTGEFEKLHTLRHGNVLRLIARVKGEMALITEHCERGSLHEVLHGKSAPDKDDEKQKFALDRAWSILLQLADALQFLHLSQPQPIVHRDVKSGNCLLTTAWTLKLADFDMARTQLATAGFSTKTQALGTFNFKSPEQFAGAASAEKITVKSDIYAFGGVMIDVLTGQSPFTGCEPIDIISHVAVHKQPPPELKLLSAAFPSAALFAAKCLSQDPTARPTAAEASTFCKAQLAAAELARQSEAGLRDLILRQERKVDKAADYAVAAFDVAARMEAQARPSGMPAGFDFSISPSPCAATAPSSTEEKKEKPTTTTPTASASTSTATTLSAPVASWSVADVCAWLSAPPLSLAKHAPKFQEAVVDGMLLLGVTSAELRNDLGVTSSLEQRRIMIAIEQLKKHPLTPLLYRQSDPPRHLSASNSLWPVNNGDKTELEDRLLKCLNHSLESEVNVDVIC